MRKFNMEEGAGCSSYQILKGDDWLDIEPDQVYSFLHTLGILVTLLVNSWSLWDKVKPFFHRKRSS